MVLAPESLVIGGGGLLGSAVLAELRRRGLLARTVPVNWADADAAASALAVAVETVAGRGGQAWIWWCAGAAVTGTTAAAIQTEAALLRGFVHAVAEAADRTHTELTVFFASSAGGVYAGSESPPFTEATVPRPLSAYGEEKLRSEALLGALSDHGVRVAIARIANLYGPRQNLAKPQGLISQLCLAAQLRRPLNIYVSLDTMRDYIHAQDAARRCVDYVATVAAGPARTTCKIIASGHSTTIGALMAEANRIFRRRVPVVMAASPLRRQQARDLRLTSVVMTQLDRTPVRTLAAGMGEVRRAVEARSQSGR